MAVQQTDITLEEPSGSAFGSFRVVVAMSGGVDSSLAAALVAETGVETIGVTMHLAGSRSRRDSTTR